MTDYPYLRSEPCPDCGTEVIGVVEQVAGTPYATGGLMRVPLKLEIVWMQACAHVRKEQDENE